MVSYLLFTTFLFITCVESFLGVGRLQSVAVNGTLLCNGRGASNVKVKMYEKEFWLDRKIGEVYTDNNGHFFINGSKREITTIDPIINIYHKCNYRGMDVAVLVITLLLIIHSASCLLGIGRMQSVTVSGRLICEGQPAAGVKIKMYEKEFWLDRKMAQVYTDHNGQFIISGRKREITTIDPKVNIYHKCLYSGPCYKKIGITIPDEYVTWGYHAKKPYDIGTLNLANRYTGTTTDCFN